MPFLYNEHLLNALLSLIVKERRYQEFDRLVYGEMKKVARATENPVPLPLSSLSYISQILLEIVSVYYYYTNTSLQVLFFW